MRVLATGLAAALAVLAGASSGAAQEGLRPSADTPFSARSAFPQARGALQLQGVLDYQRSPGGTDRYGPEPGLRLGITDRLEFRLDGDWRFGSASVGGRGSLSPGFRWQLAGEEGWRPAVAVLGQVTAPFGRGDRGAVTELTAIASRTTGRGPGAWGIHLNAGWLARPEPGREERRHGFRIAGAASHVVGPDTLLVGGVRWETQDRGERDLAVLEGGAFHRIGDVTLGVLAGAGLNRDSPSFVLRAAVKWELGQIWR